MDAVVKVFIYDLTKGLAKSMSLPLIGKQIDGVWHTGIVVYGQEFFYGGDGISSCPPCGTILGQPDVVVELGSTQIPMDMFMDYLHELATSSFRPQCYHLFNHNCNTFSNEVANFLTGNNIPSYVTNLPQEFLNTPFGAMIKPFVDAMSVGPAGGHELFPAEATAATATAATATASKPASESQPASAASTSSKTLQDSGKDMKSFNSKEVLKTYQGQKEKLCGSLSSGDRQLLEEICEYLASTDCDWSLSRLHIRFFGVMFEKETTDPQLKLLLSQLLQEACRRQDVIVLLKHDPESTLFKILHQCSEHQVDVQAALIKAMCNMCNQPVGLEVLYDNSKKTIDKESISHRQVTTTVCVSCILHEDDQLNSLGSALAHNLSHSKEFVDVAVELGIALTQLCCKQLSDQTALCTLGVLLRCMEVNSEVTSIVAVMDLDLSSYLSKTGQLKETAEKVTQAIKQVEVL